MSDNFNNLFFRSSSSRSASSLLRDFSPRRHPSEDSQMEDDTEIRFQLPSKKFKFEEQNSMITPKPFPKYENHLELIQSKAEAAKLQTKINALERDMIELKTNYDKERDNLLRDKAKLETRVNTVERELTFVSEKEIEAKKQLESLSREKETERLSLNEKMKQLKEQKLRFETDLAEKTQEAECRVQTLWLELNKEKKTCMEFRQTYEQTEREMSLAKARNVHLLDELKTYVERLSQKAKQCDEQAITMRQFREENQIATALRLDVAELKQLRQENASFKQQIQRYQNLSENTSLLREQKNSAEDSVKKLKRTVEKYANENNELKIVIAKNQSMNGSSPQISFNEIDYLTKQCVDLKFELQNRQERISSLERLLDENQELVTKLNEDLKRKEQEKMELEYSQFSPQKSEISVQTDSGSLIETESDLFATERTVNEAKLLALIEQKEEHIKHLMIRFGLELDFDPLQTKVVHFQMNPLDDAHSHHTNELEILRQENSSIKLRVEELEKFRPKASTSSKIVDEDVTMNVRKRLDEQKFESTIEELRAEIVKLKEQRDRVAKINEVIGTKFRKMSYLLTGYQLKMKDSGLCVMQSVFEPPERHFLFQEGPDGAVQLLDNEFAAEWRDFVETYLQTDHSIPAFLAAVTLQLFSKTRDSSSLTDSRNIDND